MMDITIEHDLGRDLARTRVAERLARAESQAASTDGTSMTSRWIDAYTLHTETTAMGFTVPATVTIEDAALRFAVEVPAMLGFARGMIESMVREKGAKLLKA